MTLRNVKIFFARWKFLMLACCLTYLFVFYVPLPRSSTNSWKEGEVDLNNEPEAPEIPDAISEVPKNQRISNEESKGTPKEIKNEKRIFKFNPAGQEPFDVEEILTHSPIKLEERMSANVRPGEKRVILSLNAGHSASNLQGCSDWNCEFTHDSSRMNEADAVLISYEKPDFEPTPNQYVVYFSQESPKNSGINMQRDDMINMTLGFRHDTPAGSPYGYTVKLGPKSRLTGKVVDEELVKQKSKGAAWFVSHCNTNSKREVFVNKLQEHLQIDKYGGCSALKCPRGVEKCDTMLNTDYHFYITFENSICKDYVTEKLWNTGFQNTIIPLVLKRSIVEQLVPPNSFIAVDDFKTVKEMGDYLNYLMKNHTAYMEYFEWRRDYKVVFLNGNAHDILERPWGFCQLCRMVWTEPRQTVIIPNWTEYWKESCEKDGELVEKYQ